MEYFFYLSQKEFSLLLLKSKPYLYAMTATEKLARAKRIVFYSEKLADWKDDGLAFAQNYFAWS